MTIHLTRPSRLATTDPADQAFLLRSTVFTVAPIVFDLDKFANVLTDWPQYLAPWIDGIVPGTAQQAKITNVFAGGNTSYLTVEATKPNDKRVTADTFAFGHGLTGQLGIGRWVHTQSDPTKIPAFSGLFEWDETNNTVIPIRLHQISVGATHAAAVMDNVASVITAAKPRKLTDNDTNWGRDILFWGNNEFYQIGSGKRNNVATPTYIQPLDQQAESERKRAAAARSPVARQRLLATAPGQNS